MIESVDVQTVQPIRVAAIKHRGAYNQIGPTFGRLAAWAGPRGMFKPNVRMIGVYYDNPRVTPADQLRSDACIECDASIQPDPSAGVEVSTIPGGRFVVGVFKGHYSGLEQAWVWLLGQWIPTHGHETADRPCFEVYLNDPMDTKPEDLLTAIHVPIE